jgi:HEAT repeat protein
MLRSLLLPVFTVLTLFPGQGLRADEPAFLGKPESHWRKMLQEGKTANERRKGLIALTLIGPEKSREVLPAVVMALRDDPDAGIRRAAAQALGRMSKQARTKELDGFRYDQVRIALVSVLKADKSGPVRAAAATSLGEVGSEAHEAIGALAAILKDEHEEARAAAANTLRRLGKAARDALPDLQQALRDSKSGKLTRLHCATAIGVIGLPDAVDALPVLREVLADTKAPAELRKTVAETLGQLGQEATSATPILVAILNDNDTPLPLRRAVLATIAQIGVQAKEAVPALHQAVTHEDRFIRCLALHALGGMGTSLGDLRKPVITSILAAMNDSVLEVRLAAIQALGSLGAEGLGADKEAVLARLEEASRDSRKAVQETAQQAIQKIQRKKYRPSGPGRSPSLWSTTPSAYLPRRVWIPKLRVFTLGPQAGP